MTGERFRVVPAAYVVLRRGDEVLMQRRQGTGYMDGRWACAAAGHVEHGETVYDAAVREALEEIGIGVSVDDLTPITSLHRTGANGRDIDERVDWFFDCRTWTGEPVLREPDKASDLAWHPLGRLPEDTVPHERHVLERWWRGDLRGIEAFGFRAEEAAAQRAAADASRRPGNRFDPAPGSR